jgi:hypothetical protein
MVPLFQEVWRERLLATAPFPTWKTMWALQIVVQGGVWCRMAEFSDFNWTLIEWNCHNLMNHHLDSTKQKLWVFFYQWLWQQSPSFHWSLFYQLRANACNDEHMIGKSLSHQLALCGIAPNLSIMWTIQGLVPHMTTLPT